LHILVVDEHGRMNWQKASGYTPKLAGDGLTSDVSNVAAANADIAKLVVSHLG